MDDEVYVVDSSSSEGSAMMSNRSSSRSSVADKHRHTERSTAPLTTVAQGDGVSGSRMLPPMTVSSGTCTEREFTADDDAEAALHREIARLAALLPNASRTGGTAGSLTGAALRSPPPPQDKQRWVATLQSLKRPRSSSPTDVEAASEHEITLKREGVSDDVPYWAADLAGVMQGFQSLAAHDTHGAEQSATVSPICLLAAPEANPKAVIRTYEPQPPSLVPPSSLVSTLEAEARLVIGREHANSLLPLYKELLQLRREREHTVLDEATRQEALLGSQQALLEELETTCRRGVRIAQSAFHQRCAAGSSEAADIYTLEEEARKLQVLRTAISTSTHSQSEDKSVIPSQQQPVPALVPNERREPGSAASTYLRTLENTLDNIQEQNAQLQSRLEQLAATNRQLQERCAASARDAALSAQEAGWVRKEVVDRLLSARQHSLEAVVNALGCRVVSASHDEIVLVKQNAVDGDAPLTISLSASTRTDESPTAAPEAEDAVVHEANDLTASHADDERDHERGLNEVATADIGVTEVRASSPGDVALERLGETDKPDATLESLTTEEQLDEPVRASSASRTPPDDGVRSLSSGNGSGHSALLEDPGAPAEQPLDEGDGVSERTRATESPVTPIAARTEGSHTSLGEKDEDELMNRTDETLVASMNDTQQSSDTT